MKNRKSELDKFYQIFEIGQDDLPERYITYRELDMRSFLFEQGQKANKLFFILKGAIIVGKNIDLYDEQVNYLMFAPCTAGIDILCEEQRYTCYARGINPLKIMEVDRRIFRFSYKINTTLNRLIGNESYNRLIESEKQYFELYQNITFGERIKEFLLYLFSNHGRSIGNTIVVQLRITHRELAHYLKTSRQSITMTFSILRKQKIIDYNRVELILLDFDRLHQWESSM